MDYIIIYVSGYTGNLMACLTYPARDKELNEFKDLLQLPKDATVGTVFHSSMNQLLRESNNSVLQGFLTYIFTSRIYSWKIL